MVFLDSVHILNSYIFHFCKCSFPTFCNLNSNKNFLAFLHFTRDSKNILKAEIKPVFIIVVLLGVKIRSTNLQARFKIFNSVSIYLSIFYLSVYYLSVSLYSVTRMLPNASGGRRNALRLYGLILPQFWGHSELWQGWAEHTLCPAHFIIFLTENWANHMA